MHTPYNKRSDNRVDYGIILSVFMLFIISMISVYATSVLINQTTIQPVVMHFIWYILGAMSIVVIMQIDSKRLWQFVPIIYMIAIVLLIAILFLYDRQAAANFGAKSWFRFGGLSFQPAEFSKIALILMLSRVITQHNVQHRRRTRHSDYDLLSKMILCILPILVLVMLENDLGTTLVIVAISAGMILLSGIHAKILIVMFGSVFIVGGTVLYLAVYHRYLLEMIGFKQYQFVRIDSWLNPMDSTAQGAYQLRNSILAIATGGLFGKGIGVTHLHVPVRESDMIFATIGENAGLIGTLTVLFVYFALIYQMIRVCFDTKNEFYTYISVGVISMIFFHVFENIGMNIGVLPLTGIPLPFISQGGSSLVVNMMGIGLIMSMRFQSYHDNNF